MSRINSIDFKTVFEFILFVRIFVVFFFFNKTSTRCSFQIPWPCDRFLRSDLFFFWSFLLSVHLWWNHFVNYHIDRIARIYFVVGFWLDQIQRKNLGNGTNRNCRVCAEAEYSAWREYGFDMMFLWVQAVLCLFKLWVLDLLKKLSTSKSLLRFARFSKFSTRIVMGKLRQKNLEVRKSPRYMI